MTTDLATRALALLRTGTGIPNAGFRADQLEAIDHVVTGKGRLLVVQRTGWGKSFVYFIATKLLREQGAGPALLISPLLALMRNQIAAAERMGVNATTINSANASEWERVEQRIAADDVDILLISPERLANDRFLNEVLGQIAGRISLLVVDEAHCISDWGHDFRPHYRLIERIATNLPGNLRLLATTATANDRVMSDLSATLGPGLTTLRGDLARPSLALQTIRLPSRAERLAWLADELPGMPGSGVVYTLTHRDTYRVAEWLRSRGIDVAAYTAGEPDERREQLEQELVANQLKVLVATTALGMGFDKPDLAFVVHYQAPGSVVAYYQQVGRAGRSLATAYGVLLAGSEDMDITSHFIDTAFPSRAEVEEVIGALEDAPDGLSVPEIERRSNVKNTRIQKAIQLLSLEAPAPLARSGSRWQLTAATLNEGFWERADRLTSLRRDEQRQMQEYVNLSSGHMEFLIRALDGDPAGYSRPDLPPLPSQPDPEQIRAAVDFLGRLSLDIEPRRTLSDRRRIDPSQMAEMGKALCDWGDPGWGELVRRGKYRDECFDQALVTACADLVRRWAPHPEPLWVTAIPSRRHPRLVPDFAKQLAATLDLPYRDAFVRTREHPEQKAMQNSAWQARNVADSMAVQDGAMLTGPVLLVDDIVDSRWTVTVAAQLLREAGSGEVWPLALARASGR